MYCNLPNRTGERLYRVVFRLLEQLGALEAWGLGLRRRIWAFVFSVIGVKA